MLGFGMYWSVKKNKLTEAGALTGGLLGLAIFQGAGFTGLTMLALFFVLGTGATAWQHNYKARLGLAEENKGRRTAHQAFANAGVAAMLGLLACLFPGQAELFCLMLAAAFAAATADTVSSELGNLYGKRFYNILTLQPDQRGLNGVISLEGTLLGLGGSSLIGLLYAMGFGWNGNIFIVILAGTIGNITDSLLGATLERRHLLSNNQVNFLNTAAGAFAACILYLLT
ncbi:hypothetical protein AAE02nite_18070 [Adhaeribacter aerolatus]|uniref:DUF92 domain-containing protein n=1 Tax=Adhaeribacter aerolatus TaxID=670289 RepID=A0A512AWP8_9BACT|nr:hypothetical protein AAE02nite_18070 [Adhaeribacter aerolatus]